MTLTFTDIPAGMEHVVAVCILECLEQLGIEFEHDETSPMDGNGKVSYEVHGVNQDAPS